MKRALPLILISSLIIPIQSPANAAIKAGGKCSVLGTSIVELGKSLHALNLDVNYCGVREFLLPQLVVHQKVKPY